MQFMIEAHSLGLSTCWAGVIYSDFEPKIRKLLSIPDQLNVLALVAVGYANETRESSRKSLNELLHYEKYGNDD